MKFIVRIAGSYRSPGALALMVGLIALDLLCASTPHSGWARNMPERDARLAHGWSHWGENRNLMSALRAAAVPQVPRVIAEIQSDMLIVPAGSFLMGAMSGNGTDAAPAHEVSVKSFGLAAHLVTFDQYDAFAAETDRELPYDGDWGRGSRPVIFVTWDDAKAFAAWVSEKTGRRFRLPTEAEWEYAARAGTVTQYPWGDRYLAGMATAPVEATGYLSGRPTPVGLFPPNSWGFYDMIGNVQQLTEDCKHDSYIGAPSDGTAWLSGDCSVRMERGGSFDRSPDWLGVAFRYIADIDYYDTGFRIAESL